ncbi:hypothetical protein B0H11DRAFT_1869004 [Mycena galericulata]|nr:hypothetical protein B0H11DRAFT_1869004 [Mycena galericulata]
MRLQPPTCFDLSPSNLGKVAQASPSRTPQTPSRRRSREDDLENIDPVLWSPSKKMRTLYAYLGSTSEGSLLLRSPKIKSSDNAILPPVIQNVPSAVSTPNWSLSTPSTSSEPYKSRGQLETEIAVLKKELVLVHQNITVRDQIIEEGNATMVLQNLGLKKMNQALHQQEEKATTDCAKLFKGKAQCLSSDEFYQAVVNTEKRREEKEAGKEANKVARQKKKEMREEVEREWAAMKERHISAVEVA